MIVDMLAPLSPMQTSTSLLSISLTIPRFPVLPKRWIVERTSGRLGKYRHPRSDKKQDLHSGEIMNDVMLRYLASE